MSGSGRLLPLCALPFSAGRSVNWPHSNELANRSRSNLMAPYARRSLARVG